MRTADAPTTPTSGPQRPWVTDPWTVWQLVCDLGPDRARQVMRCYGSLTAAHSAGPQARALTLGAWAAAWTPTSGHTPLAYPATPAVVGGPGYPSDVATLPDAPPVLFATGRPPRDLPLVAVAGTRHSSPEAAEIAVAAARAAADAGVGVVAPLDGGPGGLALRTALDAGAPVVAVAAEDLAGVGLTPALTGRCRRDGVVLSVEGPGTPWSTDSWARSLRLVAVLAKVVVVCDVAAHLDGGSDLVAAAVAAHRPLIAARTSGPGPLSALDALGAPSMWDPKLFGTNAQIAARVAAGAPPVDALFDSHRDLAGLIRALARRCPAPRPHPAAVGSRPSPATVPASNPHPAPMGPSAVRRQHDDRTDRTVAARHRRVP